MNRDLGPDPVADPADDPAARAVRDLLERSHRYGADPTVTNYGGGNTSVAVTTTSPATGEDVRLLYVKGSGGDLATLAADGLAVLELDRARALDGVYRGVEHEDEMVGLFPHCSYGAGGAAPSIDTPMHALVGSAHVDHLHPDAVIALACAADGPALVQEIWGGAVAWVPWQRPGWELGRAVAALAEDPGVIGAVLGGHGLTAWGATSEQAQERSLGIIEAARTFLAERSRPEPFGPVTAGREPIADEVVRRARAVALFPLLRRAASASGRVVGHHTDTPEVLDFLSRERCAHLVSLGTSCPDHFLRTKVRPLLLDVPVDADLDEVGRRLDDELARYQEDYSAYYERHADAASPPMRGSAPAVVLVPGVGMFSFGADHATARVAGEFYVNALHVMRGAEGVSTYAPIGEREKFRVEYWALEEAKLARRPAPKALAGRVALVTGAASGIGLATARLLHAHGADVVIADLDLERGREVAAELGAPDRALAVRTDVTDEHSVAAAVDEAVLRLGGVDLLVNNAGFVKAGSLESTSLADWDAQFGVLTRGSFIVTKAVAPVVRAQGLGGDVVVVCSKNAIVAGPDNLAYSAAKAAQAHLVRLLATELGPDGIRVNGINPDGVVRGSGIFAGGWGASRAKTYGVPEEELGKYYAQRTVLKEEVLPEHVASAVLALTGGALPVTTGQLINVDSGVAAAFLR